MDYGKEILEHEKKLAEQVSVKDGHIVINVEYEYNIGLNRCDTPEKLLHWIFHLCEKTWMTNDVMQRFILLACHENNIEMQDA